MIEAILINTTGWQPIKTTKIALRPYGKNGNTVVVRWFEFLKQEAKQ